METQILALLANYATERAGFELLVKTYTQKIYYLAKRMVQNQEIAEDITQDTFVKIWLNIRSFRGQSSLYSWIYRIATNECLAHIRRQKMQLVTISEADADTASPTENLVASSHFDAAEVEQKLLNALTTLPEKQRIVFDLKFYEAMKYEDMSDVLGTSVGALKASYHHAVKKIEHYFNTH